MNKVYMQISRKEYKRLIDEIQLLKASEEDKRKMLLELAEYNIVLSNENKTLNDEICQLKVKYVEEVKKNFYFATRLLVKRLKQEL